MLKRAGQSVKDVCVAMVMLLGLLSNAVAGPNDIAVIIVNKDYERFGTADNVRFAEHDGDRFKDAAIRALAIPPRNILMLANKTASQLKASLGDWSAASGPQPGRGIADLLPSRNGGRIWVFYSGHGLAARHPGIDMTVAYLLPVDVAPADVVTHGVAVHDLERLLEAFRATHAPAGDVVLALDACFSGRAGDGRQLREGASAGAIPVALAPPVKLMRLAAAQADEVAWWDTERELGLFTDTLLDALFGLAADPAITKGRVVTKRSFEAFARRRMTERLAQLPKTDGRQRVAISSPMEDGVLVRFDGEPPIRDPAMRRAEQLECSDLARTGTSLADIRAHLAICRYCPCRAELDKRRAELEAAEAKTRDDCAGERIYLSRRIAAKDITAVQSHYARTDVCAEVREAARAWLASQQAAIGATSRDSGPPERLAPKGAVATAKLILGMRLVPVTDELRSRFNIQRTKGLVVTEVAPESASAQKSISVGDVIVEVGQETVETVDDVVKAIEKARQAERKVVLVLKEDPTGALRFAAVSIEEAREAKPAAPEAARIAKEQSDAAARQAAKRDPAMSVAPGSGKSFRDRLSSGGECAFCPDMVVVPAGSFMMGSTPSDIAALVTEMKNDHYKTEGPQRRVAIARPFAVGRFAVTFAEWDACLAGGGCQHKPDDRGWGRGKQPVINVSWDDTKQYVAWISAKTGQSYRLLSEAEREYAARAGTTTAFWWGSSLSTRQANYDGRHSYAGSAKGEYRQRTVPVDSFAANPWGLYQVHGNVYNWVEDCYHGSYQGAPNDGSAWTTSCSESDRRVVRGGSWDVSPQALRSAFRGRGTTNAPSFNIGFRLARTLDP